MLLNQGEQIIHGIYNLHSKFDRVFNFACADMLLSIVDESIGAGPINIVTQSLVPFSNCGVVEITPEKIIIGKAEFLRKEIPVYDSMFRPAFSKSALAQLIKNVTFLQTFLCQVARPEWLTFLITQGDNRADRLSLTFSGAFAKRILAGSERIKFGEVIEGVAEIKGCGYGLTPSGDDFNAGLLLAFHILRPLIYNNRTPSPNYANSSEAATDLDSIYNASLGNNIFSNNFLYLAKNGCMTEKVKNLVISLFSGDTETVRGNAQKVIAIGETSGADFLTGVVFMMRKYF